MDDVGGGLANTEHPAKLIMKADAAITTKDRLSIGRNPPEFLRFNTAAMRHSLIFGPSARPGLSREFDWLGQAATGVVAVNHPCPKIRTGRHQQRHQDHQRDEAGTSPLRNRARGSGP